MFIKSSLLAVTFVFLSIGSTIAAEVPAIQDSAWEPQPELIATESDTANNWKIRYELPIGEILQPSSNLALARRKKRINTKPRIKKEQIFTPPQIQNTPTNIQPQVPNTPSDTQTQIQNTPTNTQTQIQNTPTNTQTQIQNTPTNIQTQIQNTPTNIQPEIPSTQINTPPPTEPKKWAVGIHAQAATTGFFGFDAGYKFSPNLHARLGLNTGGFKYNLSQSDIDYSASFQPTNIHLLGDYFPFGGGLRFTGGFVIQNNRFTATAKPNSSGQININGTNYPSNTVGTLEGQGSFSNSIAPYLGIGLGTPIGGGFGFNLDAGVMFSGSPRVSLSAPTAPQAIKDELAIQEQKTNEDIKGFNMYPVVSIGFSYAF